MQEKIYPNLIQPVLETFEEITQQGAFADKAIERVLKSNKRWGARDRHFIASHVYGMVRHKRLLEFICKDIPEEDKPSAFFKTHFWLKNGQIPNVPKEPELSESTLKSKMHAARQKPEILHSFPDWMAHHFQIDYPDAYRDLMSALNQEAEVVLRANRLKTEIPPLLKHLTAEGIQVSAFGDGDALKLSKRANVFRTDAFKKGFFEVQDKSSQEVAVFLDVKPGMHVIDACAGAGGKSLHLSALMQAKGRILSMDTEAYKLAELKKRAKRAGAGNIETRLIDGTKTIKRLKEKADRLLLDVPCTGTGVLRRNPDSKWKIDEEFVAKVVQTQQQILELYSKMLKPGGKMVYATCSVLSKENEEQIALFLATHPNFELEEEKKLLPHVDGFDGFYMARIKRKEA